jgi:hypothetical protein
MDSNPSDSASDLGNCQLPIYVYFSFGNSCVRMLVPTLRSQAEATSGYGFPSIASAVNYKPKLMLAVSFLWKLEDADLSQDAQFHARSLQALHQFKETAGRSLGIVMAGIAVAIARLEFKVPSTQQKSELPS